MSQQRVMIELPGSSEALHNVLQMLMQHGLISNKKVTSIQKDRTVRKQKKNRWANAAERLQSENCLKGRSAEVKTLLREFREDFEM